MMLPSGASAKLNSDGERWRGKTRELEKRMLQQKKKSEEGRKRGAAKTKKKDGESDG